jgi:hypothetical protein
LESGQKERAPQKTIASKPKPHTGITKSLDVFGSTSPQENFDHFSFTCHLFPHLSESNLQFHDLYWNKQPATGVQIYMEFSTLNNFPNTQRPLPFVNVVFW